jgi:hypothetical protein
MFENFFVPTETIAILSDGVKHNEVCEKRSGDEEKL